MRRVALLALVLIVGACTARAPVGGTPTPSPTREPGTYSVTALLDLSGARGPHGDAQRSAMQQWADVRRTAPRVKLRIVDVGGSDAKLVLELKRAADAGDTDAFIVGVPTAIDDVLSRSIALAGRPMLFTLPIPEPTGDSARWIFGLAPAPAAIARVLVDALPGRGTPAVIVTSGTLAAGREELALVSTFRRDGRPPPVVLSAAPEQRDTFVDRARPYLGGGAAAFFAGPTASYLDPQRLVPAADPAGDTLVLLSYLTDASDAGRLGDAAPGARWPGLRRPVTSALGTHAATATDALALLATSADAAGDPERSRARIEGGTFAGIAATYTFGPSRHVGPDPREITLLGWENGRVVLARPAR